MDDRQLHRGDIPAARLALHGSAAASEAAANEYHIADRVAVLGWLAWEDECWEEAANHLQRSGQLRRTGYWHTLAARFRLLPGQERAAAAISAAAVARWPWLSAVTLTWQGELLGDRGAPEEAAAIFQEIGAESGVVRAERVLRRLGVRTTRAAAPLSEREMEVARLIAEGLSNPAIAARPCLSRPTVASHVSHILTKLGFSARSQIAVWVAEHHLVGRA